MSKTAIYYKVRDRLCGYVEPVLRPILSQYYTDSSKSQQRKELTHIPEPPVQKPMQQPPRPKKV
jgi:hypothetical protein